LFRINQPRTLVFRHDREKKKSQAVESGVWEGRGIRRIREMARPGNKIFTSFVEVLAVWFVAEKVCYRARKNGRVVAWESYVATYRTELTVSFIKQWWPFVEIAHHTHCGYEETTKQTKVCLRPVSEVSFINKTR